MGSAATPRAAGIPVGVTALAPQQALVFERIDVITVASEAGSRPVRSRVSFRVLQFPTNVAAEDSLGVLVQILNIEAPEVSFNASDAAPWVVHIHRATEQAIRLASHARLEESMVKLRLSTAKLIFPNLNRTFYDAADGAPSPANVPSAGPGWHRV